ncbi:MAG TPA: hypothetical protein PKW95_17990 [bacterium]|nr:hypothetical protein [bacterium]
MSHDQETVLCQSCGAPNSPSATECAQCGAVMAGVRQERDKKRAKAQMIEAQPEAVRQQLQDLEAEHERRPDAVGVCLQLANLYKDLQQKEFAVEYLEKAIALDPANKFLKQKLQLLVDGRPPDKARTMQIEKSQAQTKRYTRYVGIGAAVLAVVLAAMLLKSLFMPGVFCLAPVEGDRETINPKFSSDGSMVAYLDQPRFTLFGMVDQLTGQKPKGETWLMVKTLRGKGERVVKIAAGRNEGVEFAWRPRHDELTYVAYQFEDVGKSAYTIYSVSINGGEPRKLVDGRDFAWSHDGAFLAYVRTNWSRPEQNGLYLLNVDSKLDNRISDLDCSNPSWSPTEQELVYQAKERWMYRFLISGDIDADYIENAEKAQRRYLFAGDIYRYDFISDATVRLSQTGDFRTPMYRPDGQGITALTYTEDGEGGNTLVVMSRDGDNQVKLLTPGSQYEMFGAYCWAPNGKTLAFEGFFPPPTGSVDGPATGMPSGMSLFVPANKNYVSDIFVVDADGSDLHRLDTARHPFKKNPVFSPDGKVLAFEVMYMDFRREIWAMKY